MGNERRTVAQSVRIAEARTALQGPHPLQGKKGNMGNLKINRQIIVDSRNLTILLILFAFGPATLRQRTQGSDGIGMWKS